MEKVRRQLLCSADVTKSEVDLAPFCPGCKNSVQGSFHARRQMDWTNIHCSKNVSASNSNGTLASNNDSGYSSKCSSTSHNSINKKSEFEHCGEVFVTVRMNSRKEMQLRVSALKADVTLSDRSKIPTLLVEISSKPASKSFRRKTEVELVKAVNGIIFLDAIFNTPIDSILGINSITVTIFKSSKYSYRELGFVEIPIDCILPNINKGDVLLECWLAIFRFVDSRNGQSVLCEDNKENEKPRKRQKISKSIVQPTYESISHETSMAEGDRHFECRVENDHFFGYGFDFADSNAVFVRNVVPGGCADRGGLKNGDLVISVNGVRATSLEKVNQVVRGAERMTLMVTVARTTISSTPHNYVNCREDLGRTMNNWTNDIHSRERGVVRPSNLVANTTFTVPSEQGSTSSREHKKHRKPSNSTQMSPDRKARNLARIRSYRNFGHEQNSDDIKNVIETFSDLLPPPPPPPPPHPKTDDVKEEVATKWPPFSSPIANESYDSNNDSYVHPVKRGNIFNFLDSLADLNIARIESSSRFNTTIQYGRPKRQLNNSTFVKNDDSSIENQTISYVDETTTSYDRLAEFDSMVTEQSSEDQSISNVDTTVGYNDVLVELRDLLMTEETTFLIYSSYVRRIYMEPLKKSRLDKNSYQILFQNFDQLIDDSEKKMTHLRNMKNVDKLDEYVPSLMSSTNSLYRPYIEGCRKAFLVLEKLCLRDEFYCLLEHLHQSQSSDDEVKSITSCLLLPMLHLINISRIVSQQYSETTELVELEELSNASLKVIEFVNVFWTKALEKIKRSRST